MAMQKDDDPEHADPEASRPLLKLHLKTLSISILDLTQCQTANISSWLPLVSPGFRATPYSPSLPLKIPLEGLVAYFSGLRRNFLHGNVATGSSLF